MRQCFIRKYNNGQSYADLYKTYKIYVLESKGINEYPERKESFKEDWADANGIKIIERTANVYKSIKVMFKFAMLGDNATVRTNFKTFWKELNRVVPSTTNPAIGSSLMEYYDSDMGVSRSKKIRLVSGSNDLEFESEKVEDIQNLGVFVDAITFKAEFSIDKPDVESF